MKNSVKTKLQIDSGYLNQLTELEQRRELKKLFTLDPKEIFNEIISRAKANRWSEWKALVAFLSATVTSSYNAMESEAELENTHEIEFMFVLAKLNRYFKTVPTCINTMDQQFQTAVESNDELERIRFYAGCYQMLEELKPLVENLQDHEHFTYHPGKDMSKLNQEFNQLHKTLNNENLDALSYVIVACLSYTAVASTFADWLKKLVDEIDTDESLDRATHTTTSTKQ